ncbi:MAG TPA: glycoside hydrolase family 2 TIM barrel-domain containing protein [Chitinophagaceae bacterium]
MNIILKKMFKQTVILCFLCAGLLVNISAQIQTRKIVSFDADWRFLKADNEGTEKISFDDSKWRKLDVPHDWSIEGPYDRNNPTSRGGGYLPAGIGWYRKTFSLDDSYNNKKVSIQFDGVMANSDVWINGFHLGKRPYGYISFVYDLTGHLNIGKGKTNVLAVRADNSIQPASRYYTGAGIYRHVKMIATNPVHLDQWSVFITTSQATSQKAVVNVKSKVVNQSSKSADVIVEISILDASGKTVKTAESKQTIAAGKDVDVSQDIEVANPQLWYFDKPVLYKAVTKIHLANSIVDDEINPFGIRTAKFEAATGFWLNDKNIKLKGVCLHHDGGAVGAAVPTGVWRRRLALLKQAGVNAIRTSHNPVAPEFLDLCDQMGFAVMDETFDTWTAKKPNGENGYNLYFTQWWDKDTRDMVLRDRNHPSIVIYSVGNEIHDDLNSPDGFKKYKDQQDLIHLYDGTRPVTMALFRPAVSHAYTSGLAQMMDVVGQNYRENELIAAHEAHPDWKVIGTENTHVLNMWLALRDKPYMAGQFLWTGFDYLGEENWPLTTNTQGLFDRIGTWKPTAYQRQSWWSDKPVVHIVRKDDNAGAGKWVDNWTPTDFGTYDDARIQIYSNCDDVELFLNGKSLGSKHKPADDSPRDWSVPFEKGSLKAVGKNNGKEVATEEYKTAGAPAKIVVSTDQSSLTNNWNDVAFVYATIVDANGVICPNEDSKIKFTIEGNGVVDAVDNGNTSSHDIYQASEYPAFNGRCLALVKTKATSGKIVVKASAANLQNGSATIDIKPDTQNK